MPRPAVPRDRGAPKMDGPRRPGGPRAEGPRAPRGPEGRRGGEGRRGDGDRGPRGNRPDGPRPQLDPNRAPIMAAGWILIEEKYDADKDGKLNEAEMHSSTLTPPRLWNRAVPLAGKPGRQPAAITTCPLPPLRSRKKGMMSKFTRETHSRNRETAPSALRQAGFFLSGKRN